MMRVLQIALLALLALVAVGALVGGTSLVRTPDGSGLGMTLDMIARSPFSSYRIPGALLAGLGALHAGAFVAVLWRWPSAWLLGAGAGAALVVWIGVQVTMVELFWLQPAFFTVGVLELAASLAMRRADRASARPSSHPAP